MIPSIFENSPDRQNQRQSVSNLNNLLSIGLLICTSLSLCVVIAGFVLLYINGDINTQPFVRLDQIPAAITIHWGILALILTPVIQVIIVLVKFFLNKDRIFASISLLILVFLGICFALAFL